MKDVSLSNELLNAKIKNLSTHIKALKRVAYGFRNFRRMRTRIFLINHLITY
ncbi:transposase [Enterococcus faecalis]|nr:transposase [Enterococcus faecalis]MDL4860600.1 transposase [Enterococcus faecalis]MDL4873264.1 transposase [Enterococcus faecalis]MDL4879855.1 transposase [Enterococcus faecalis]MDL4912104.1 transposase [Enterococcus faecalis]MDL4925366.1 transposase [Enterococcus faecalis]